MSRSVPLRRLIQTYVYLLCTAIFFTSCVTTKKSVYFNDIPQDASDVTLVPAGFKEPIIQADDIISITIQTLDPQVSNVFNQNVSLISSVSPTNGNPPINGGYLVDKAGLVELPMIGKLKLAGLTTFDARELIHEKARLYFKDPTVQVRFANFKINVIGEVMRPATYIVPNEKVSLLDAISLAGDLTIYGKRENVLLIRDTNGEKKFIRLDLNSSDLFKSPYFYLKQNDVVYVEPSKAKVATTNAVRSQTLTLVGSALSVLIVLLTRLKF